MCQAPATRILGCPKNLAIRLLMWNLREGLGEMAHIWSLENWVGIPALPLKAQVTLGMEVSSLPDVSHRHRAGNLTNLSISKIDNIRCILSLFNLYFYNQIALYSWSTPNFCDRRQAGELVGTFRSWLRKAWVRIPVLPITYLATSNKRLTLSQSIHSGL